MSPQDLALCYKIGQIIINLLRKYGFILLVLSVAERWLIDWLIDWFALWCNIVLLIIIALIVSVNLNTCRVGLGTEDDTFNGTECMT